MDKCKILTNEVLKGLLKAEPRQIGKRILDSVKGFGLPLNVLEDTEVVNDVEVHVKEGDLWYCFRWYSPLLLGWSARRTMGSKERCIRKCY